MPGIDDKLGSARQTVTSVNYVKNTSKRSQDWLSRIKIKQYVKKIHEKVTTKKNPLSAKKVK